MNVENNRRRSTREKKPVIKYDDTDEQTRMKALKKKLKKKPKK